MTLSETDKLLLHRACELAFLSPPAERAYSVGVVIAQTSGELVIEGYSRMNSPRSHAEQDVILQAAKQSYDLSGCTLYSSLQPCYRRLSGARSCQSYIIEAGLKRVIYAAQEPNHFLKHAGDDELTRHGIKVTHAKLYLNEVHRANSFTSFS